jgi:serine/threonine-protein kinase
VSELRLSLEKRVERERATSEAMQRTQEYLAANDLAPLLEPLESVQRTFGETTAVSAALADLRGKRTQIANSMLAASMDAARQCLAAQQPARAVQAIETYARFAEFADAAPQAEWRKLAQEAGKAAGVKSVATGATKVAVKGKGPGAMLWVGVAVGVVLIAVAGVIGYKKFVGTPPAEPVALTYLNLNAAPYAEVVKITSDQGKDVALPAGDHTTPLRLEGVPAGSYAVQFQLPSGETRTKTGCVIGESAHLCALTDGKDLTDAEIDKIIEGQK